MKQNNLVNPAYISEGAWKRLSTFWCWIMWVLFEKAGPHRENVDEVSVKPVWVDQQQGHLLLPARVLFFLSSVLQPNCPGKASVWFVLILATQRITCGRYPPNWTDGLTDSVNTLLDAHSFPVVTAGRWHTPAPNGWGLSCVLNKDPLHLFPNHWCQWCIWLWLQTNLKLMKLGWKNLWKLRWILWKDQMKGDIELRIDGTTFKVWGKS